MGGNIDVTNVTICFEGMIEEERWTNEGYLSSSCLCVICLHRERHPNGHDAVASTWNI